MRRRVEPLDKGHIWVPFGPGRAVSYGTAGATGPGAIGGLAEGELTEGAESGGATDEEGLSIDGTDCGTDKLGDWEVNAGPSDSDGATIGAGAAPSVLVPRAPASLTGAEAEIEGAHEGLTTTPPGDKWL